MKEASGIPEVIKSVKKDIPELGTMGLTIVYDIGEQKTTVFENCIGCEACVEECPESALHMQGEEGDFSIAINLALCNGLACRRCEKACQEKVFSLKKLFTI